MDIEILISLGAILVLLILSAFFSGSETSLTAVSMPRMHTLEQQGDTRARIVNDLWRDKERLIGAILLGNNLVNIMASALATGVLIRLFGDAGVAYATVIMTLLVLIFAEVMPKTYALHNADRMALAVAPVMRIVVRILFPVTHAIHVIVRATLHLFGIEMSATLSRERSEEELRGVIELHAGDDEEVRHERAMLRSILDLADVEVGEIITHRKKVVSINADLPPSRIVEEVLNSPHTRLPLWKGEPDNIVGVLHVKALLRAVHDLDDLDKLDVMAVANPPWFIPESTDLLSQLQAFRARHEHFAIVVDEYGEVLGIVTLEDILEEIVGEIADEHDVAIGGVKIQKDGSVVVDGSVTIRDLNRQFEWRLPDEEASTIAGLILHEARRIPEVGQTFVFHGFRFEILGRQRNQITSVKITPLDEDETQVEPEMADAAASPESGAARAPASARRSPH
ncbi:MAG: HlyC/CorC family transporter [Alphaproteobacteria bacterium]|nr:MAG: HlyC/CorC family transporter [Alphaproteobacteria bacterium]